MMNTHHQKEEVFCRGDESCRDEEDKRSPPGNNKLHLLPSDIELETSSATPSRFIIAFTNSVFVKGDAQRLFIFSGEEETSSSSLVANLAMTIPSVTLPHGGFKCTSVHGFVTYCHGLQFTICNPSAGHCITFPCKDRECTSLGYDPVDDQFKVLTPVSSLLRKPSFVVHEVITLGRGGE
ncbi:hypothetical protein Bca52824_021571 [Brassica carinata]|uniref:F-box associated beta-propeller type 3 domain-containing protein n=1 Tax=Brassica carinata TaxID=52824 RepID=A0A8X8AQ34_BRACI|nr:hypothetical protein Bca52824_021571 [Brassica carinata]